MQENQYSLNSGTTLNHYEIIRVLGTGSFGITYLAKNTSTGVQIAIKEYFPSDFAIRDSDDSVRPKTDAKSEFRRGRDRFREEAKTLMRFDHPSIVKILDYFEANHTAYFVMTYEEGIDLDQYLRQQDRPLGQEEILGIVMPILEGLKEVHAHRYLHRDIKPGNILLRENKAPVLIDFGASKVGLGETSRSVTSILTEGYAPPEQYTTDAKKQGPFSDLYALAAVMYKMITGEVPPSAQTRNYAVLSDEKDPYWPLAERNLQSRYDQYLLGAIDAALALDARRRPQSVQAFQAMLFGRGEVPSVKPTEVLPPDVPPTQPGGFFSFEGRIGRAKYWIYNLIAVGILFFGALLSVAIMKNAQGPGSMLMLLAWGVALWAGVATQVKRWHDLDQSGWLALTSFIPYIDIVVWIVLGFLRGTDGPNRYGVDPLPVSSGEAERNGEDGFGNIESAISDLRDQPVDAAKPSVTLLGEGYQVPSITLKVGEEVTVGRSSSADIIIRNKYISKRHLSLRLDEGGMVTARDLSSTNGTYLGGKKLEPGIPYELRSGERLILGSEDVVFRL